MVLVNEVTNALQGRMSEKDLNMVTFSHPYDGDIRFILNMVTLSHPCDRNIPFLLNIVTLSHPCDRNIPFILNIKKPNMDVWLDSVNLNLTGTRS